MTSFFFLFFFFFFCQQRAVHSASESELTVLDESTHKKSVTYFSTGRFCRNENNVLCSKALWLRFCNDPAANVNNYGVQKPTAFCAVVKTLPQNSGSLFRGGGAFSLACESLGRRFDNSFHACPPPPPFSFFF